MYQPVTRHQMRIRGCLFTADDAHAVGPSAASNAEADAVRIFPGCAPLKSDLPFYVVSGDVCLLARCCPLDVLSLSVDHA